MPARFIVSEYAILWDALKHYERHLERVGTESPIEDERIAADERLIKLDSMFKDIQAAARQDWDLELK